MHTHRIKIGQCEQFANLETEQDQQQKPGQRPGAARQGGWGVNSPSMYRYQSTVRQFFGGGGEKLCTVGFNLA